jgi:predicted nucleotidyltransferase
MRDLSRDQLLAELRALRPEFEREGVAHMTLFGSRARGEHTPGSDVDIVLEIAPGRKFGLEIVGVYHIIEDNLGLESSLVVLDRYADPRFVSRIQQDFLPVF